MGESTATHTATLLRGLNSVYSMSTHSFRRYFVLLIAIPQNTSLLNTELSAAVASSSGPQRSKRGATRREKETEEGTGARKRTLKRTLSPDINWAQTCDRFYWEMVKTYMLQPSGGLPTPMAAYARIKKFIKEDLHQSVSNFFFTVIAIIIS